MPENTGQPDTPQVADTPNAGDAGILADLTGKAPETPADAGEQAEKKPEPPENGGAQSPEGAQDDTKGVLMREDYLKHKAKLAQREKELEAEREQLRREAEALKSQRDELKKEAPKTVFDELGLPFDPDKDFEEGSEAQVLGQALKKSLSAVQALKKEVDDLRLEASRARQQSDVSQATYIQSVLDGATHKLSADPMLEGLSISPDDVGEALLSQGEALVRSGRYTQLTPEMAIEAWKRENYELLLAAAEKRAAAKQPAEKKPVAPPLDGGGGGNRLNRANMSDDDAILADLKLGLA